MSTAAQPKQDDGQVHDPSGLFDSDGYATIDAAYLRDSCRCSLCVDTSNLQRNFVTAHIPADIQAVFHGHTGDGQVRVGWHNDIPGYSGGHESTFSQPQLHSLAGSTSATAPLPSLPIARKRQLWDRQTFADRASMTPYTDFTQSARGFRSAMSALHRDGLIFVTETPADPASVGSIASRLGPLRNTFYGPTWDVRSMPDSKNVAFTNHHLGFHMDLLYMTNPPGYQLLHALRNSCDGGESLFADGFHAAARLRQLDPPAYDILCRHEVEWRYENDNQRYWQRRPTFQQLNQVEKRDGGGGGGGELAYINWSPPFQGRLPYYNQQRQQDKAKNPPTLRDFLSASRLFDSLLNDPSNVFQLKMDEGTCVIFENRRIVHARNAFKLDDAQGGDGRWLRGAYVDEDPVWSRWRGLGIE